MATFPDQLSSTFKDFFQSLQAATPKSSATAARAKVPCCCWDPVFGKHSNIAGWSPSIILMLFPHTKAGYKWEILGVDMVLDGNGYQLQSICYDLLQWPEQIIDLLTSKNALPGKDRNVSLTSGLLGVHREKNMRIEKWFPKREKSNGGQM